MSYLYENLFIQRFENFERVGNFGYDGLRALYSYLEGLSEDTGEPLEVDVIGLCCEFARYETLEDFQREYGEKYKSVESVQDETTVIPVNEQAFIIQSF